MTAFRHTFATAARCGQWILIVKDEMGGLREGEKALTAMGYEVLKAADGETALRLYERYGADIALVICDWVMPPAGGCLLSRLRQFDPRVSLLVVTGGCHRQQAGALLEAGAKAVVLKPYAVNDLTAVLRRLLPPVAPEAADIRANVA